MKKLLSMLLAASMLLAVAPMTVSAYNEADVNDINSSANLALHKEVIKSEELGIAGNTDWQTHYLTDGSLNLNGGGTQYCGYHSLQGTGNRSVWVGVDLGATTAFDTMVIYPSYEVNAASIPEFPSAFSVEVSDDNEHWTILMITVEGYTENAAKTVTGFKAGKEAVTIHFAEVEARYVRFNARSLNKDTNNLFCLKLSEMAIYDTDYVLPDAKDDSAGNLLKGKAPTITSGGTHSDWDNVWIPDGVGLTDGDRYNMNTSLNNDGKNYGQYSGFHTTAAIDGVFTAYYDLGASSTFDQIWLYPSTTKYAAVNEANDGINLPGSFTFSWADEVDEDDNLVNPASYVYNVTDADKAGYNGAIVMNIYAVTARYFQISFAFPASGVKLSELELYNTAETIGDVNVNLAYGATAIYSGVTPNMTAWQPFRLNNGIIEENGGYTTNNGGTEADAYLWVGYDFGAVTKFNRVVLYSSYSDGYSMAVDGAPSENSVFDVDVWSGIPKKFDIQISDNGFNWTTVKTVINEKIPVQGQAYSYDIGEQEARYVRVYSVEAYGKPSDGNSSYIQLAEMQVLYSKLDSRLEGEKFLTEDVGLYGSVRKNGDNFDLRVVMATKDEVVTNGNGVIITFFKGDELLGKSVVSTIGEDDWTLYQTVTGAGKEYTAADGCSIFGCVVYNIPNEAFDQVVITITDANGLAIRTASATYALLMG